MHVCVANHRLIRISYSKQVSVVVLKINITHWRAFTATMYVALHY